MENYWAWESVEIAENCSTHIFHHFVSVLLLPSCLVFVVVVVVLLIYILAFLLLSKSTTKNCRVEISPQSSAPNSEWVVKVRSITNSGNWISGAHNVFHVLIQFLPWSWSHSREFCSIAHRIDHKTSASITMKSSTEMRLHSQIINVWNEIRRLNRTATHRKIDWSWFHNATHSEYWITKLFAWKTFLRHSLVVRTPLRQTNDRSNAQFHKSHFVCAASLRRLPKLQPKLIVSHDFQFQSNRDM